MTPPLELLIQQNYARIENPECVDSVLEFIASTESVVDKGIIFIKQLTKVADNIYHVNPSVLQDHLERVYLYHDDGIKAINSGKHIDLNETRLLTIESHLHSHAADFAYRLWRQTDNSAWLEKAYNHRLDAADLLWDGNPGYVAINLQFAANYARRLYESTGNTDWLDSSYEVNMQLYELAKDTNRKKAANALWFAAKAQDEVYMNTRDRADASKAIATYQKFIEYSRPKADNVRQAISRKNTLRKKAFM